jgi:hypothetical protein
VRRRRRHAIPALLLALLVPLAGCGSGEHEFTPEEFIDTINEHGAGLALGPTVTDDNGIEVRKVTFTVASTNVGSPTENSEKASGGTLLVVRDADAAREVFQRCDSVEGLTCFRAANAVLRFERMDGADQARIVTSLEAIQTESN